MNRTNGNVPPMTTAQETLVPPQSLGLCEGMTDTPPNSPFKLNPSRIILLLLGALAITYIVGALMGGVENYDELKKARDASMVSEASSAP